MKKNLLLLGTFLFLAITESYAQSSQLSEQSISIVISGNPTLLSYIQKIESKELEISNAVNSNRSHIANLNQELSALKAEYKSQLYFVFEATESSEEKDVLKAEIARLEGDTGNH